MLDESPELARLRAECLTTSDAAEFKHDYATYKRKGGIRKLVFYPKRAVKKSYKNVIRIERNGKISCTHYANQISKEFIADCAMLQKAGMRNDDIAVALAKNFGFTKESSVRYVLKLGKINGRPI